MTTYFDSSVLVQAYCLESTSPQTLALLRRIEPPYPFTPFHALEIRNALRSKRYRKELTQFQMRGALRDLQNDVEGGLFHLPDLDFQAVFSQAELLSEEHTAVIGTRSLDILHVASALLLGCPQFASYDQKQRTLARRAGLKILPAWRGKGVKSVI